MPLGADDVQAAHLGNLAALLLHVLLGADFVAITKFDDADWSILKPQALAAIMDHFVSGAPVIADVASADAPAVEDDVVYEGETAEIVAEIKELIATRVRPAVANDGGDIIFKRFDVDIFLQGYM